MHGCFYDYISVIMYELTCAYKDMPSSAASVLGNRDLLFRPGSYFEISRHQFLYRRLRYCYRPGGGGTWNLVSDITSHAKIGMCQNLLRRILRCLGEILKGEAAGERHLEEVGEEQPHREVGEETLTPQEVQVSLAAAAVAQQHSTAGTSERTRRSHRKRHRGPVHRSTEHTEWRSQLQLQGCSSHREEQDWQTVQRRGHHDRRDLHDRRGRRDRSCSLRRRNPGSHRVRRAHHRGSASGRRSHHHRRSYGEVCF